MVQGVLDRVAVDHPHSCLFGQLVAFARPALALAAAVALVCFVGAAVNHREDLATADSGDEPAVSISSWATGELLPSTAALLAVLGDSNAKQ